MKDYYGDEDMKILGLWPWMPMFISLGLVLLTLFIFLTTFAEKDKIKIDIFKRSFRQRLTLSKENWGITVKNRETLELEMGARAEPVLNIVNRIRSKGINKKLMDEFLTLVQVKNLGVVEGKKGVCIIIPEAVIFKEGKTDLLTESAQFLARISFLVSELPYLVEIKGCASSNIPSPYRDPLEFSIKRALQVYNFFLGREISPEKLKISGYGDAFMNSGVPQDKVEIIFKEAEL